LEALYARSETGPELGKKVPPHDEDPEFARHLDQLPRRAQTVLRNRNITSFGQLAALKSEDLKGIPNCGRGTIEKILGSTSKSAAGEKHRRTQPERDLARLVKRYGLHGVAVSDLSTAYYSSIEPLIASSPLILPLSTASPRVRP